MKFSVIIPTFNEEDHISACLDAVLAGAQRPEIIVVDCGSTDRTTKLAGSYGVTLLGCSRSRGTQLNAGARKAHGDVLLFLHADTMLPEGWLTSLEKEFNDPRVNVGLFRMSFDGRSAALSVYSFLARYETRFTSFGDQCIVARRGFFFRMGGFPEWPLFEDVRFLELARKSTRVKKFALTGTTSSRKFIRNGPIRQQLKNIGIFFRYCLGASPFLLAEEYYNRPEFLRDSPSGQNVSLPDVGEERASVLDDLEPHGEKNFS